MWTFTFNSLGEALRSPKLGLDEKLRLIFMVLKSRLKRDHKQKS